MFLLTALILLVSNSLKFVEAQPGRLVLSQGETVTLSCSPPNPTCGWPPMLTDVDCSRDNSIFWRKRDGAPLLTDISHCLSFYRDYTNDRFTIDYSGNKYNLHISNVQPNDAGEYLCVVYSSDTEGGLTHFTVQLNVLVSEPSCSANPQTIKIGDYVSLVCSLQISRALQWVAPNGTVVSSRPSESGSKSNPVQPLVFNFIATEEHNFQTFSCEDISESGTYKYNPSCSVTPLKYTFINISPLESRVKQGDNVVFNCDARLGPLGPHRYHYIWLRDDNIVLQGFSMLSYSLHNIRLCNNGTRVRCKASINSREEIGSSEAIVCVDSEDDIKTLIYCEELTNTTSIEFSFNTLTIYLLVGGAILLVTSFSVNVALVVCLVKSRKARNNIENLPTGDLQMTYIDLQQQDVTNAEYENCRVESDTYVNEAVGLDVEYEVPQTSNAMDNPVDTGIYDYAVPNA